MVRTKPKASIVEDPAKIVSHRDDLQQSYPCSLGYVIGSAPFSKQGKPRVMFTFGSLLQDDVVLAMHNIAAKVAGCQGVVRVPNRKSQVELLFSSGLSWQQQIAAGRMFRTEYLKYLQYNPSGSDVERKRKEKEQAEARTKQDTQSATVPPTTFSHT
jgi:hypothetical protein